MTAGCRYVKIIEWSDVDNCFIGSCPELFYGGCHGRDERQVFDELCQIIPPGIFGFNKTNKGLIEYLHETIIFKDNTPLIMISSMPRIHQI